MRYVIRKNQFKKSYKKCVKRGCAIQKLDEVIFMLIKDGALPLKYRPHKLVGNRAGQWECHVEPDWLLVYNADDKQVILHDTGTHSDLF